MEQNSNECEAKPPTAPVRVSQSFRLRSQSLNDVRLRRIFDSFDSNGDGQISVAELGQALQRLGLPIPLPELEVTVRGFFSPGSDGLDFHAFVGLHRSLADKLLGVSDDAEGVVTEEDEQDLREAFGVFDEDGDGFISASELQGVLRRLGLAEANDVQNMIHSVDANRDGLVDFLEFKHMMTNAVTVKGS